MSSSVFQIDKFIFDPRPKYPFLVTVKRYRVLGSPFVEDHKALTLIFTHGTSFHKETWEPTMEDLVSIISRSGNDGKVRIREIWAIDCPNHGEAAAMNEGVLQWGYDHVFGWEQYGRAIYLFLTGKGTGVPADFSKHRLLAIGHSMGAVALVLSLTHPSPAHFESFIAVEPMLMSKTEEEKMGDFLSKGAKARRDVWPRKEDALKWLSERPAVSAYDPRVLQLYCEFGMRELATAGRPDRQGVTLSCSKHREAACYADSTGRAVGYNFLSHVCRMTPTHIIFGTISDILSESAKEDIIQNSCKNLHASVRRIENAGHLVGQTQPTRLAETLFEVLSTYGNGNSFSRL